MTEIGAILASLSKHTGTLATLRRHMTELRANMREQRKALREVRAAAATLCAMVTKAQEKMRQARQYPGARAGQPDTLDLASSPVGSAAADASGSEIDD